MADQETQAGVRAGVRVWFIKQIASILIFGTISFVSAGRLDWPGGWAYLATLVISMLASALFLKPGLLAERENATKTAKTGIPSWLLLWPSWGRS